MSFSSPEEIDLLLTSVREIMTAINLDDTIKVLNETDLLINIFDPQFKKEHSLDKLQKKLDHFLKNENNMRILRLQQKIKSDIETSIEYFDIDRGNDSRLFFNQSLENDINDLYSSVRIGLSIIIKSKLGNEITF